LKSDKSEPRVANEAGTDPGQGGHTPDPPRTSRRQFAKWTSLTGIAAVAAGGFAVWRARSRKFPRRVVASADEVPVGGTKIFTYPTGEEPCILLRPTATTYVAYSRLCTHNACPVFFDDARNAIYCPCHAGVFSVADGAVLEGPPPHPLPRILLERDGASIVATSIVASS
jgi:Rieske Fe-S protein